MPADRARLAPLVQRADVIVEQFRPGVMARLGLDYDAVAKVNPMVVYCSITGYGQDSPKRDVAGHDLNYIGDAGLLALSMGDPSRPVVPPALIADIAGGAYPAVLNILLALEERRRTGRGRHLDVAMADNLFPFMFWALGQGLAAGAWPTSGSERLTGGSPRYALYPTSDGKVVTAAPLEQKFWDTFCDILGLEGELRDDRKNGVATKARVAEIIAAETAEVWRSRFAGRDCCCSIVADISGCGDRPALCRARRVRPGASPIPTGQPCRRCPCRSTRAFARRARPRSRRRRSAPTTRRIWPEMPKTSQTRETGCRQAARHRRSEEPRNA